MKNLLFALSFFSLSFGVFAQNHNGYRIEIKIDGLKDTTLLLGYHFGDKKFVSDTARIDSNGVAIFEGDSLLKGGIYLVILPDKTYFEVLLSNNQRFGVQTTAKNMVENLKFTGSKENEEFIHFQQFMMGVQAQSNELSAKMKDALTDSTRSNQLRKEMNELDEKVKAYWLEVENNNRGTFLASIIKAMRSVEVPEFTIPANTPAYDSLKWVHSYNFNRDHYFDNIDFSDSRLLRTPILENKINIYFDRVLIPHPDSIAAAAVNLVEKSKANREMFQYILSYLINKFQTSERMGMDGVFAVLAEKYYLGGQAWWADQKLLDKISERVNALKPNLIGKVAPDLWLPDPNGKYFRLSNINSKITVIFFWDPECSHCKKEMPKLKSVYDNYKKYGLEVYAVYTQGDQPKWMESISKNDLTWINVWDPTFSSNFRNLYDIYSTPVIYVLDSGKKIIAKRISVETLESILKQELKL
ncbi:MAG: redoxin domain-containing protein [Tenuifilaceae bacterium]